MDSLFDYNGEDKYSLTEFFWKFKDRLPIIVTVIEGDYDPARWGDLGIGQIIRYNNYYTQKRVLARRPDFSLQMKFLSIPLDAMYEYHVVKGKDKVESAQSLPDILKTHDLPVLIQFSETSNPPYLATNDDGTMANLLITHAYENHYLLGNCIESAEGVIDSSTVVSNIDKNIAVTPVLGFSDDDPDYFKEYLASLDRFIEDEVSLKYDDMSIKTYDVMDEEIKGIVDMSEVIGNDVYDELCPPLPKRTHRPPPIPERKPILDDKEEESQTYKNKTNDNDKEECSPDHKHLPGNSIKSKFSCAIQGFREKIKSVKKEYRSKDGERSQSPSSGYVDTVLLQTDDHCYSSLRFDRRSHISDLSVQEVGEVLTNLNLSEHVDEFCQKQVDGILLLDVDIKMLTKDFNFTQTEAEILMTYVSDGSTR